MIMDKYLQLSVHDNHQKMLHLPKEIHIQTKEKQVHHGIE